MKWLVKLLKSWTDESGASFKAGDIVELPNAETFAKLIADGTAEKANPEKDRKDLEDSIGKVVGEKIAAALKPVEEKIAHITTHEKSDDDPSGGYLPQTAGREHTKNEKMWGLGTFCKDVYSSAVNGEIPKRLKNSIEKSRLVIQKAIEAGYVDKAAGTGYEADTGGRGGFVIPPEFNTMLLDAALETAVIRPRASTMQIGSTQVNMPQFKNYNHSSDTLFGGMAAYWEGENDQITSSRGEMEQVSLNLHALCCLAYVSHKMMQFSEITVGQWLLPQMAQTITWKEEDGFINGTGAGQPQGIKNAPGAISVAIETGQTLAASALVTENILKMYQQCRIRNSGSTIWLYNKVDLFYWLSLCTIDVGTGGAPAGLIQRLPGSPDMNMLGIPLVDSEHCEAAGTVGDIYCVDLSQYLIADDRRGPQVAESMHIAFDYGQSCFRMIKYVDGCNRWKSAFTRQNSTNTEHNVVNMAART